MLIFSFCSLLTLTILLQNVPLLVRPFHPQLTRTMIKSVSDTASLTVRNRAAAGLGELMKHQASQSTSYLGCNKLTRDLCYCSHVSILW